MFIRSKGQPKLEYFPKKASTVFAVGDLCTFDGSGNIQPYVAGTTTGAAGICKKAIAATDSDYAANTMIPVDVNIGDGNEFIVDANGAITASLVGTYKDIITNAGQISNSVATNTHVLIVGLTGVSTQARVRIHQQAAIS